MLSLWESLWPTLGKQSPQHVISLTKTWKTKLILWPRLGKPSLEPSISCLLYDKNFESSESWEIQLHDQDIMDSQALNDSCLWPKLDKQVMMENPTLRKKSKITSPGEMCFLTNTWTTKSWSIQLYDQNKSLRNQLYEQTLDKQILNFVTRTWPECQRIQSVRNRIRETQSGGHGNWLNLTLWSAYLSTVPPWGHPSSETVTHEARRCVRKNRPSCNGVRAMKKLWNQVLKLASKTRKAKSQMDPFQNLGKPWNPALKLASKTRKAKSQMDP